jgi:hypothetical protein
VRFGDGQQDDRVRHGVQRVPAARDDETVAQGTLFSTKLMLEPAEEPGWSGLVLNRIAEGVGVSR